MPVLWLLLCGFVSLGCGGCSEPPSGTIVGQVAYKGEPVFLGTIAFHSADGRTASAAISAGKYHAEKVPLGPAKVTVQSHAPSPQMTPPPFDDVAASPEKPPPPRVIPKYVPLPPRYASPSTSPLSCDVHQGEQTHDVALTP